MGNVYEANFGKENNVNLDRARELAVKIGGLLTFAEIVYDRLHPNATPVAVASYENPLRLNDVSEDDRRGLIIGLADDEYRLMTLWKYHGDEPAPRWSINRFEDKAGYTYMTQVEDEFVTCEEGVYPPNITVSMLQYDKTHSSATLRGLACYEANNYRDAEHYIEEFSNDLTEALERFDQ